jgi:hypothetical protein
MVLERRMTSTGGDDRSSGKTRSSKGKRPAGSRTMSRNLSRATQSPQSRPSITEQRASSGASIPPTSDVGSPDMVETPSLTDLQQEEERIRLEEDEEVERKRQAAARLAAQRGLSVDESSEAEESVSETKHEPPVVEDIQAPPSDVLETREDSVKDPTVAPPTEGPSEDKKRRPFVPARLPHFG